ncbi:FkbM family methyltransferase [Geomonas sp. RF6]|uniref:FkbM family methyltransferase n=1 Tax=Geomonas sp. RF6 TaxID=2897342 RepID=UPI001E45DABC|nr:FkbM family methyltransferase [Geomonas sp. RF6]UFS72770.1 FkbM family methyltransferase [Geomonas sp. RF6]
MGENLTLSDFVPPVVKKVVRRVCRRPAPAPRAVYLHEALGSFSQYQEDLIIDAIFRGRKDGVYVDVGANDPVLLSNTKRFYDRGWCGVNVEPTPHLYRKLAQARPRDINLEMGVGPTESEMTFYLLNVDTLSSFDRETALRNVKEFDVTVVEERPVKVIPLVQIFERYLDGRQVDLLSVDTEGCDLTVLQSNRWDEHRPEVVIVETNQDHGLVGDFLATVGYTLVYQNHTNGIFLRSESLVPCRSL